MIKVLIVDDSAFIRKVIKDILEIDKEIEVVGLARNGKEALEKIPILNPDVITLDIEMPVMDGIETLREIVNKYKIPVIMLSSLTTEGADLTLKALEIGAVDFVQKPKNVFNVSSEIKQDLLIEKIKIVSKSNLKIDDKISGGKAIYKRELKISKTKYDKESFDAIVAIGTSTGGPRALQQVIPKIPKDINAAIVIVQHMPPGFTKSLANRLDTLSHIKVKEGEDGEKLMRGCCYIAPGDFHMSVIQKNRDYIVRLDKNPPISGLRPAADILMESVSKLNNINKLGIILTGMGSDGAKGIVEMKKANSYIIAEDEKSCIVFGMPKSAINTGSVDLVLPLDKIGDEIINRVEV